MEIDKTRHSLGSLFADLSRDTTDLVRQEIALARTEMSQKVPVLKDAAIKIAAGGALLLLALFILLLAVVGAVAMILPVSMAPWLAPLLVGAAAAIIGYMFVKNGREKLSAETLIPHRTINSFQRDKTVIQETI